MTNESYCKVLFERNPDPTDKDELIKKLLNDRESLLRDSAELAGVMVSVEKWFELGDQRLKTLSPTMLAADAREIALKRIEELTRFVERQRNLGIRATRRL